MSQTIPALSSDQPDIASFAPGLSERDVYLIRSIEWLNMMPETMHDALVKSNDVARYFLCESDLTHIIHVIPACSDKVEAMGQASAAQSMLRTLPPGIAARNEDAYDHELQHELEHQQFQKLFGVFACYDIVEEVLSRIPKET